VSIPIPVGWPAAETMLRDGATFPVALAENMSIATKLSSTQIAPLASHPIPVGRMSVVALPVTAVAGAAAPVGLNVNVS